jgi:hypothetical protein
MTLAEIDATIAAYFVADNKADPTAPVATGEDQ